MEVLTSQERIFFVYRHIRPDKNQVFYIGIGRYHKKWKHCRAYTHRSRNQYWKNIVSSCDGKYKVQILFDEITMNEAFDKEKELIKLYGRKDLNSGTLCNMTDGGDGGFELSEETKRKISEKNRNNGSAAFLRNMPKDKRPKGLAGSKNPMYGVRLSEETKRKISEARRGIPRSAEACERAANSNRGKKRSPEFCQKMKNIALSQLEFRKEVLGRRWISRKEDI